MANIFKRAIDSVAPIEQAPATLEERHAGATALAEYALHAFSTAADDLELAAGEQDDIATAAQEQLDGVALLRDAALDEASRYRESAAKIRSLFPAPAAPAPTETTGELPVITA